MKMTYRTPDINNAHTIGLSSSPRIYNPLPAITFTVNLNAPNLLSSPPLDTYGNLQNTRSTWENRKHGDTFVLYGQDAMEMRARITSGSVDHITM